jgi:hypothetical protein
MYVWETWKRKGHPVGAETADLSELFDAVYL